MTRVSRRHAQRDLDPELSECFVSLISSLNSPQEIELFLDDFLTLEEKTMLAKRLMLHLLLEKGFDDFEIASTLNMSRETVRVHKLSKGHRSQIYRKIITRLSKGQRVKELFSKMEKVLDSLGVFLETKTNMKARAKLMSGDW